MFIEAATVIFIEALQAVFDAEHPNPGLRDITVSPEYPSQTARYPALWVQVTPTVALENVGVGHVEYAVSEQSSEVREVHRWRFGANAEITVVALTNLERAALVDAVATTIAYSRTDGSLGDFRRYIEDNDLVGLTAVWESFTLTGANETQGTPWGSDEIVYEMSLVLELDGEVAFSPSDRTLVPLSQVRIYDRLDTEPDILVESADPIAVWQ